nr:MAG TPA: hypothetical protein [Caudoviricetes sp.]
MRSLYKLNTPLRCQNSLIVFLTPHGIAELNYLVRGQFFNYYPDNKDFLALVDARQ